MEAIAVKHRYFWTKLISGLIGSLAAVLLLVSSVGAQSVSFPNSPTDCDSNAVIRCGALTTSALQQAYQADSYTRIVFQNFGISSTDIQNISTTAVAGTVTKSGNVIVNGKTVATNAMTAGRTNMAGSTAVTTQGITFYRRPPSVSFAQDNLDAYVVMSSNNQFRFAVIASCGNPVTATPVAPPAPKPTPSAVCKNLNVTQNGKTITATVTSTLQNGATLSSTRFDFGDSSSTSTTQTTVTHTYNSSGTFKITARQTFSTGTEQTIQAACTKTVTIAAPTPTPTPTPTPPTAPTPQPTPPPTTPVTPTALPNTGAGSIIGLFTGSTIFGTIGYRTYLRRKLAGESSQ